MSDEFKFFLLGLQLIALAIQIWIGVRSRRDNLATLDKVKKTNQETKELLEEINKQNALMSQMIPSMVQPIQPGICCYCKNPAEIDLRTMRCEECKEKPHPEDKNNKFRSIDDPWEMK